MPDHNSRTSFGKGTVEVTLEAVRHPFDIDAGGTTTPSNLKDEGGIYTVQKGSYSSVSVLKQDATEQLGTYMTNANLRISEPFLNINEEQQLNSQSQTFTTDAINAETFQKQHQRP